MDYHIIANSPWVKQQGTLRQRVVLYEQLGRYVVQYQQENEGNDRLQDPHQGSYCNFNISNEDQRKQKFILAWAECNSRSQRLLGVCQSDCEPNCIDQPNESTWIYEQLFKNKKNIKMKLTQMKGG